MFQMTKHYELEFEKRIVHLHLEEGRSLKSLELNMEYHMQVFPTGQHSSAKNAR